MSDIVTGIKLKADGSGLVGEMKKAKGQVDGFGNATEKAGKKAKRSSQEIAGMEVAGGKLLKRLSQVGGALLATFGSTAILNGIVSTARRFEILQASLITATGTADDAEKAFKRIQVIAASTPYSVEQLTTAFIKLTNLGLTPSEEAIRSYGNTASAMGKSLDQFVEAVADASVAEFERLKEFGIKAKNQGDTIEFMFRGVKTSVKNNAQEIEGYLQNLGKTQFAGAMTRQAQTLDGAISNLGDSWDGLRFTIAQAGLSELMQQGIRGVSEELGDLTTMIASGEMLGYLQALANHWTNWGGSVEGSINSLSSTFMLEMLAMEAITEETLKFLGDAFLHFPQNVRAMIQIVAVELASLIDVGREYGAAFARVVGTQLAKLVDKAGIYGKELADIMAFWDGDTYDADSALAAADKIASGMTNKYLAEADKQVAASRQARLDTITGIVDERDAALASFAQQIAAAKALAAAKQTDAANDDNFSLGQFGVTPETDTTGGGKTVTDTQLDSLRERLATKEQVLGLHLQKEHELLANAFAQKKIQEDEFISLSQAANRKYFDETEAYNLAKNNLILSSAQQIFGAMADLAATFGGKQSKAFKVMFAVQKGFAIAQGVLNLSTAISNASAIPFPANIPLMATAAATGATLLANIKGAQYAGAYDKGGYIPAGQVGLVGEIGPEFVNGPARVTGRQRTAALMDQAAANDNSVRSITKHYEFNIDATNAMPGVELLIRDEVTQAINRYDSEVQNDFANNGSRARLLTGAA